MIMIVKWGFCIYWRRSLVAVWDSFAYSIGGGGGCVDFPASNTFGQGEKMRAIKIHLAIVKDSYVIFPQKEDKHF